METRPATATDTAELRRITRAAWEKAYGFLPDEERDAALNQRYSPERLESGLADDDAELLAATVDGDLVGYAHAIAETHADSVGEGELRGLFVAPDHWRTGVGTSLLAAAEDRLRERGFSRLKVPVFAENEGGIQFLEANGFERIEERVTDLYTGGTRQQYVYHHQFTD